MGLFKKAFPRKSVFVDETPVEVEEDSYSKDLIRASGRNPATHTIFTDDASGGSQLIPTNQRIKVRDGQQYRTSLNGTGG